MRTAISLLVLLELSLDIDFAAKCHQILTIEPMQYSCLVAVAAQEEADEPGLRIFPVASTSDCQQCLRDLRAGAAAGRVRILINPKSQTLNPDSSVGRLGRERARDMCPCLLSKLRPLVPLDMDSRF